MVRKYPMMGFSEANTSAPDLRTVGEPARKWNPGSGFIFLDSDEVMKTTPESPEALRDFSELVSDPENMDDMQTLTSRNSSEEQRRKAASVLLKGLFENK